MRKRSFSMRIFSLMLVLAMAASCLPMSVLGAGTAVTVQTGGASVGYAAIEEAFAAIGGKTGTMTLQEDISITETLEITADTDLTLDLNGHNITMTGENRLFMVRGIFTLQGEGILSGGTAKNGGGVYVNAGTFNMKGGTISGCTVSESGAGIYITGGGTVNMSGGLITECASTGSGGGIYVAGGSTLNMTDGRIADCTTEKSAAAIFVYNGIANISGGVIPIASGLSRNTTNGTIAVSGGWFASKVSANYRAEGYTSTDAMADAPDPKAPYTMTLADTDYTVHYVTNNGSTIADSNGSFLNKVVLPAPAGDGKLEGWYKNPDFTGTVYQPGDTVYFPKSEVTMYANWGAVAGSVVFRDGTTTVVYKTISEAFSDCGGKTGTMTLMEDVSITGTLEITADSDLTLDLNGHNITMTGSSRLFMVRGTFTLQGEGILSGGTAKNGGGIYVNAGTFNMKGGTISDCSVEENGGGLYITGGGTANISGGIIENCSATKSAGAMFVSNGTANISDCIIKIASGLSRSTTNGTISVTGGWFASKVSSNYVAPGYVSMLNKEKAPDPAATYTVCLPAVNLITGASETAYNTLELALEHYTDDSYLVLNRDVDANADASRDLLVDLNGFTLNGSLNLNGKTLSLMDASTDAYGEPTGKLTATVSGTVADSAKNAVNLRRYVTVKEADGSYTANRIYLAVTAISYRPADEGVGYRVTVGMNQRAMDALRAGENGKVGVKLWVGDFDPVYVPMDTETMTPGAALTKVVTITNQLEAVSQGITDGNTPVNAMVYADFLPAFGEEISVKSVDYSYTLQEMMTAIDSLFPSLAFSDRNRALLLQVYEKYEDFLADWMPNIRELRVQEMPNVVDGKIRTVGDLQILKLAPAGAYTVTEDIDLGGRFWEPGDFSGTLSGVWGGAFNHTIRNFTIEAKSADEAVGFFRTLSGQVSHLNFEDVTVILPEGFAGDAGIVAGILNADMENVTVRNCTIRGSAGADTGLLVGKSTGVITNCKTYGTMELTAGSGATVGGVAGRGAEISSCESRADITCTGTAGKVQLGGIAGYGDQMSVVTFVGGITVHANGATMQTGVLAGYTKTSLKTGYSCATRFEKHENGGAVQSSAYSASKASGATVSGCVTRDNSNPESAIPAAEYALRRRVLDYTELEGTVAWTPETDMVYAGCTDAAHQQSYTAGEWYFGLPYTHYCASYEKFGHYLTEDNMIPAELSASTDWHKKIGNDCADFVFWGLMQVAASPTYTLTDNMICENGMIPVGTWTMGVNADGKNDTAVTCAQNGEQVMYEAYAQIKLGDVIVKGPGGHARIAAENAYIFRNSDGTINAAKSYIITNEQGTVSKLEADHSTCRLGAKYTFANLFKNNYVPVTIAEYTEGEQTLQVTLSKKPANISELSDVTVQSNKRLNSVSLTVYEGDRYVLDEVAYPAQQKHITGYSLKDLVIAAKLDTLPAGSYTARVYVDGTTSDHCVLTLPFTK